MRLTDVPIVLALGLPLALCACSESESGWFVDSRYSTNLTILARSYATRMDANVIDTIDAIQIFRTTREDNRVFALQDLRRKPLVLESRDRGFINRFFAAAQAAVGQLEGCDPFQSKEVLHILAFDRTLMRVGYLRYYRCTGRRSEYGATIPIGDPGISYTSELPRVLREAIPELPAQE